MIKILFKALLGIWLLIFSEYLHAVPPGTLDKNFGGDGLVDTPVGTGDSVAEDVLQQTDGKLVAVGRSNGGIASKDEFVLARYLSDGKLDSGFSEDGKVNTAVGSDNASAFAVLEQADHKLVVVGQAKNSNPQATNDFAVVRYLSDGRLDTSFSQDGIVLTPPGSTGEDDVFEDGAYAVVEMPDHDLVVAGFSGTASDSDFALVRYHQDGSLNTSFSPAEDNGKAVIDFGSGNDVAFSLIRQSDGKLVAAGFSSDGSKDDFAIARFNADGTVDNTFNANGRKRTSVGSGQDHGHALIQQQDGKLVVAGYSTTDGNEDIALVRYNLDGSLDTGFSGDGKVRTDLGSNSDRAYQVLETVDHKLLVAGYTQVGVSDFDFVLMRYDADGTLDTSFGASGIIKTSFGTRTDQAFAAVQQADQNIVLAGVTLFTDQVPNQQRFALARYVYGDEDSDGVPDGDDNCIAVANPDQINTDKNFTAPYEADDLGDACDSDDDGDGVPDEDDAFPLLPGEVSDNDGDGIGDVADVDDDNDCSLDDSDPFPLLTGVLNRFSGEKKSDNLGYSVANAGDLDNDGIDDVIVGVPRFDVKSDSRTLANAGRVTVYSGIGKSGVPTQALYTFTGEAGGDEFGSALAGLGDVNGDGVPDIAVGAPKADVIGADGKKRKNAGLAVVFSGKNGDRLLRLEGEAAGDNLGKAVGFVQDVDGDGRDEIIAGAWKADKTDPVTGKKIKDAGAVYIASFGLELPMYRFEGENKGDLFGFSVAANDVSGDGKADAVIGAYRHDVLLGDKKLSDAGRVYVYSLTDGSRIAQFDGAHAKDWLGYAVASAYVDGDDYAEVLAGAPKEDFFPAPPQKTVKDAGIVHVYSGAGKNRLYSAHHSVPQAGALFGSAVGDAGQPSPDTRQHNFVVGAYKYDTVVGGKKRTNAGRVTLHRASDGVELFSIDGDGKNNSFGFAVSSGRFDNDAYPDIIVGGYLDDPVAAKTISNAGIADVVTGIYPLDKRSCKP